MLPIFHWATRDRRFPEVRGKGLLREKRPPLDSPFSEPSGLEGLWSVSSDWFKLISLFLIPTMQLLTGVYVPFPSRLVAPGSTVP